MEASTEGYFLSWRVPSTVYHPTYQWSPQRIGDEEHIITGSEEILQCGMLQKIWERVFPPKMMLTFMPSLHLHPMMSFHSTSRKADIWDALAADNFLLLPPTSFLREWDIIEGYRQGPFWHLLGMILLLWSKHNYSLSPGHKINNRRISARSTPLEKGIEPPFWRWWAERERLIKMLLADASMQ